MQLIGIGTGSVAVRPATKLILLASDSLKTGFLLSFSGRPISVNYPNCFWQAKLKGCQSCCIRIGFGTQKKYLKYVLKILELLLVFLKNIQACCWFYFLV